MYHTLSIWVTNYVIALVTYDMLFGKVYMGFFTFRATENHIRSTPFKLKLL